MMPHMCGERIVENHCLETKVTRVTDWEVNSSPGPGFVPHAPFSHASLANEERGRFHCTRDPWVQIANIPKVRLLRSRPSKSDTQSQTRRAATIDALLREGSVCFPEIRVCIVVFVCQCRRGSWDNRQISDIGEQVETPAKISIRHADWMIEDIVEVGAKAGHYSLADFEILVHSKVYSPASRTPEKVSFGDSRVVKYIGAEWRRSERTWIEHLISDLVVGIASNNGPVVTAEITNCINRTGGDISRAYEACAVETVVAEPERRETCTTLSKHLKAGLPAPNCCVSPMRKRASKLSASSDWQVIETVQYEAMLRYPRILAVIAVRTEYIVRNSAKTGIPLIDAGRFLVQVRI